MTIGDDTYQNLLIAAAEIHYLAAEEPDSEARMRKTVLALDLERIARDIKPRQSRENCDTEARGRSQLRLVHDKNSRLID